jgi:hypothetical protein
MVLLNPIFFLTGKRSSTPPKFESLLSRIHGGPVPSILQRAYQRFSSRILVAMQEGSREAAESVYNETLALPQTSTVVKLEGDGWMLNG